MPNPGIWRSGKVRHRSNAFPPSASLKGPGTRSYRLNEAAGTAVLMMPEVIKPETLLADEKILIITSWM